MNTRREIIVFNIAAVLAICILVFAGIYAVVNHGEKSRPTPTVTRSSASRSSVPVAMVQAPSAKDIAASHHCGKFHDLGPADYAGVGDSGSCWIGNKKYAMDTFPTKAVRDNWLKLAEPLGVIPTWLTDTSVVYPSVP